MVVHWVDANQKMQEHSESSYVQSIKAPLLISDLLSPCVALHVPVAQRSGLYPSPAHPASRPKTTESPYQLPRGAQTG